MGDFNAKIGTKNDETKIGNYGYRLRNNRGERFMQYVHQNNLYAITILLKRNQLENRLRYRPMVKRKM